MQTNIYVLICPLTNHIKYVGKSNNPKRRLKDHMHDFRNRMSEFRLTTWLLELYRLDKKPEMEIVDTIEMSDWKFWEKWWIEYFKSIGCPLLNTKSGGNGLSVGNTNSFKVGNIPWNYGLKKKSA